MFMGVISFQPGSGLLAAGPMGWLYVAGPNDGLALDDLIAAVLAAETLLTAAALTAIASDFTSLGAGFVIVQPTSDLVTGNPAAALIVSGLVSVAVDHGGVQKLIDRSTETGLAIEETVENVTSIVVSAGGSRLYRLMPGSIVPADGFTYRPEPLAPAATTHLLNEEPAWFAVNAAVEPATTPPACELDMAAPAIIAGVPLAAAQSWLVSDAASPAPSPWAPELPDCTVVEDDAGSDRFIHSIDDAPTWAKEATSTPAATPTAPPRRPSRGRLLLDDGDAIELDQPVVFGRFPSPKLMVDGEVPRQIRLVDAEKRVSQQHLVVRFEGLGVVIEDQRSTNGTTFRDRGGADVVIEPGGSITLSDGVVVTMAKRRSFQFVAPRLTPAELADAGVSNG
jgi:FHA domain